MNTPQLKHIEQVADGWVKKYVLTYVMPDGRDHEYEVASRKGIDQFQALLQANGTCAFAARNAGSQREAGAQANHADAICIVARTPRDTLVIIREFRYPLNSWCVALPAGLLEPGEDMAECADRELREETGYGLLPEASPIFLPQAGYSSTGLTDEAVQVVFVEAEKVECAHTEPNELIEVFELPFADIRRFLDENELPIGTRAQLILELCALHAQK